MLNLNNLWKYNLWQKILKKFLDIGNLDLTKKVYFLKGWSPPHTAFIVKKSIHEKYGYYDKKLGNSVDFELMYRLLEKINVIPLY